MRIVKISYLYFSYYFVYEIYTERDPVSVGFLHTPNFAAFWPKPRKKRILGQCAGIMQTVLHLTPPLQMSGSCPKPKKTSRNRKILGQCAGMMQTVLHLTPLADVRLLSQNRKNIEKSKDFVQNQKKPREIEKNQKNQRFWDNVLVSCKQSVGQIGFFGFFRFLEVSFGFGQNLSISRCFF